MTATPSPRAVFAAAALTALCLGSLALAGCAYARTRPILHEEEKAPMKQVKPGARRLAELREVRLSGPLGTRYSASLANVLTRADRYSPESFRASASGTPGALWWDWPGDQVGRWLSLLSVAEAGGWSTAAEQRRAILDIVLACQAEDGAFGRVMPPEQRDARIPSGNAFALRGLLDAYADSGDARCLEAARRLGRYFERIAPTWERSGRAQPRAAGLGVPEAGASEVAPRGLLHEFYGHCLDGLVALHRQGGDEWALELARRLARHAGRTSHAHHSLSMLRGALDLHQVTGDPALLELVRDYLAWCKEQRLATGGIPESMPRSEQDEGCALADYVIVNLMMFASTGEDEFLADAEHTLVNHFFMNQFHTGGFGHRKYGQEVVGGKLWQGWEGRFGSENPGCCSIWGAWALGEMARYVITRSESSYEVNLYAQAAVGFPEAGLRLVLESDFPRCRQAALRLWLDRPESFQLALRVPAWCEGVELKLNGRLAQAERRGDRLMLARRWRSGDVVELAFAGGLRMKPWPDEAAGRVALFDGPLCLALAGTEAEVAGDWKLIVQHNHPLRDVSGRFFLDCDGERQWRFLRPIADDWQTPNVANPNHLRVLFSTGPR